MIILQSQKPKHLTALKFSAVSLHSFMAIMSRSFSYFTFIHTIYNAQN